LFFSWKLFINHVTKLGGPKIWFLIIVIRGARVVWGRCSEGGRVADCSIQFFVPFFSKLTKVKKTGLFFEFTVLHSRPTTQFTLRYTNFEFGRQKSWCLHIIFGVHITKLNTLESSKNIVLHSMIFGFFNFQCLCIKGSKYVDSILNFISKIQNLYY
jgi:hypothetical protein